MGRILCFDYGAKRVGVAVTDEQRIISTPLLTCENKKVFDFTESYLNENCLLYTSPSPRDRG